MSKRTMKGKKCNTCNSWNKKKRTFAEPVTISTQVITGQATIRKITTPLGTAQTFVSRSVSYNLESEGVYAVTIGGTANIPIVLLVNGKTVGSTTSTSSGYGIISFRKQDIFPQVEGIGAAAKPRYRIISPNSDGYTTETVREADPEQVASLRQRGYQVTQVSSGVPITKPIKTRVGIPRESRTVIRNRRIGLGHRAATAMIKRSFTTFIPKSSYAPRKAFAQETNKLYYDLRGNRYVTIRPSTKATLERRGWKFRNVGPVEAARVINPATGKIYRDDELPAGTPSPNPSRDEQLSRIQTNNKIAQLRKELEELNDRASNQLTNLGNSDQDRSNEIAALRQTITEVNERVSQQLIELGNAAGDISAALKAQQIQNELNAAKSNVEGVGSSLTGFLTNPNNLVLIGALVLGIMVLKK